MQSGNVCSEVERTVLKLIEELDDDSFQYAEVRDAEFKLLAVIAMGDDKRGQGVCLIVCGNGAECKITICRAATIPAAVQAALYETGNDLGGTPEGARLWNMLVQAVIGIYKQQPELRQDGPA